MLLRGAACWEIFLGRRREKNISQAKYLVNVQRGNFKVSDGSFQSQEFSAGLVEADELLADLKMRFENN